MTRQEWMAELRQQIHKAACRLEVAGYQSLAQTRLERHAAVLVAHALLMSEAFCKDSMRYEIDRAQPRFVEAKLRQLTSSSVESMHSPYIHVAGEAVLITLSKVGPIPLGFGKMFDKHGTILEGVWGDAT